MWESCSAGKLNAVSAILFQFGLDVCEIISNILQAQRLKWHSSVDFMLDLYQDSCSIGGSRGAAAGASPQASFVFT